MRIRRMFSKTVSPVVADFGAASVKLLQVADGEVPSIVAAAEIEILAPHVSMAADRKEAWVDVVWALLNSREFRTNH